MNILFFALLTLFLIIVQTIVLPSFSWFSLCFDLGIINIIFLSLLYSHYVVLGVIVFIGLIMDSISGGAFFYHCFSYAWIFVLTQLSKQLVFQKSVLFVFIISIGAVLIQHGMVLFSIFLGQGRVSPADISMMFKQALWAVVIVPFCLMSLGPIRGKWLSLSKSLKKQFKSRYGI